MSEQMEATSNGTIAADEATNQPTVTETQELAPQVVDAAALAVRHLTAKDDLRPVLGHVAIRDRWAYAADGFMLGRADLLRIESTEGAARIEGTALLHRKLASTIARKAENLPPSRIDGGLRVAGPRVGWFTGDGRVAWRQYGGTVAAELMEPKGPSWPNGETIIANATETATKATTLLNVDLTIRALETIKEFLDGDSCGRVTVSLGDKVDPVVMEAQRVRDQRNITVVLMPMLDFDDSESYKAHLERSRELARKLAKE